MSSFEIVRHHKLGMEKCVIPNFRVSTVILNLLQGQVKSSHFSERIEAKGKYFYFRYIFLGITGLKQN